MSDDPIPGTPRRKYVLLIGITLLLVSGIVLLLTVDFGSRPDPGSPAAPAEEPLPRSPTELLRDVRVAAEAGNRDRLVRLLPTDWAAFVAGADAELKAIADAKREAVAAVRAAVGGESAKRVQALPDLPTPWPLFAGSDWTTAKLIDNEIVVGEVSFTTERVADGTWRIRPRPTAAIEPLHAELSKALGPLKETYLSLIQQANAGHLTAATFPDTLAGIRQLAVMTAHPPPKPR